MSKHTQLETGLRDLNREIESTEILSDKTLYVKFNNGYRFHLRPNDPAIMDVHRRFNYTYSEDNIRGLRHINHIHERENLDNYVDALCILFDVLSFGDYERTYKPERGHRIIDVGDMGVTAVHFGKQIGDEGKLILIEPHPVNVEYLKRNIEENGLKNIEVVPKAAWNKKGKTTLFEGKAPGWGSVYDDGLHTYGSDKTTEIEIDTIDNITHELGMYDFNLLKMDIEGGEREAFRGAVNTLRYNNKMRIAFESHNVNGRMTHVEIIQFLHGLGYITELDYKEGNLNGLIYARK